MVRDLAWVIGSSPLLHIDADVKQFSAEQSLAMLQEFAPQLIALEQAPAELESWMQAYQDKRLGAYFARLFSFWLRHTSRFTVLAEQLAVRNAEKRTLGEFDLIVKNEADKQIEHWEIAVKFYLAANDKPTPYQWLGPGLKDSLGRKLDHLLHHQTQLSLLEEAKHALNEKGIHINNTRIILKGRLFYHWSDAQQLQKNCWIRRSQLGDFLDVQQQLGVDKFAALNKRRWLAPLKYASLDTILTAQNLQAISPNQWNVPSHFVGFSNELEHIRFFIVSDNWPETELSQGTLNSAG